MHAYILIGDLFNGFTTCLGPFATREEAIAFANADEDLQEEPWSVMVFDEANDN
jgi:hypothetical protein